MAWRKHSRPKPCLKAREPLFPRTCERQARSFCPADVTPSRLGPEPPGLAFPLLRDRLENAMYAMHGIPPALIAAQGTGTAMREAFRQVLHSLLKPLGAIIAEELQERS